MADRESMNQPLWAPWRMEYLKAQKAPQPAGCLFCNLIQGSEDRTNLILYRGDKSYVVLNRYPYNNGHLMIVPYRHGSNYLNLDEKDLLDMHVLLKHAMKALDLTYKPGGYNIGMNLGEAGGAGIKEHVHLHIVPRWVGDTNFMPVLAETKNLPQHLMASYDSLYAYFKEL